MIKRDKNFLNYILSALIYEFCLIAPLTFLAVVSTSNEVLIEVLKYLQNSLSFLSFFFPISIGFLLLLLKDRIIFRKNVKDKISEVAVDLFDTLIGTFRLFIITLSSLIIAVLEEYGWNDKAEIIIFFTVLAFFENIFFTAFKKYKTRSKF